MPFGTIKPSANWCALGCVSAIVLLLSTAGVHDTTSCRAFLRLGLLMTGQENTGGQQLASCCKEMPARISFCLRKRAATGDDIGRCEAGRYVDGWGRLFVCLDLGVRLLRRVSSFCIPDELREAALFRGCPLVGRRRAVVVGLVGGCRRARRWQEPSQLDPKVGGRLAGRRATPLNKQVIGERALVIMTSFLPRWGKEKTETKEAK